MTILGITFGHDAAACLIVDQQLICLVEEEKLSRKKSELVFPVYAVQYIFNKYSIAASTVDIVAFGGHVYDSETRLEMKARITGRTYYRRLNYLRRLVTLSGLLPIDISPHNRPYFENLLRSVIGLRNARFIYYPHHLAHAASAYYTAPFEAQASITCDGRGENDAFNFYWPAADNDLKLARTIDYRASIGQVYGVVTQYLGYKPNRHEGKIMGLAAFGQATPLVEKFQRLFYSENDQLRRQPVEEDVSEPSSLPWRQKFRYFTTLDPIARDYTFRSHWLLQWLEREAAGFDKADVAFAVQKMTEEVVIQEIRSFLAQRVSGQQPVRLALSGGVFANVRMNQRLLEMPEIENVFIQPAMNDAGLSLGAAILADREHGLHKADYRFEHCYFGADFSQETAKVIAGLQTDASFQIRLVTPDDIAQMLADNQIIGFYHGRMEAGPRALGHRSIIANTFRREINQELNTRLNRTEFMPFAPSMLDSVSQEYLENYRPDEPAGDYMTITYPVKKQYHELLQAVVHMDGTCRPHILRRDTNPYYYAVLLAFYQKTGCGAIINTSFNAHEEPIIATPQQALKTLVDKRVDVLILEDHCITASTPFCQSPA